MATLFQTDYAKGEKTAPYPCDAGTVVSYRASIALATGDEVANNIIEFGPLPAGCELVDAILDSDSLDSNGTQTMTLDVGVMSGTFGDDDNTRTVGTEIFSADATVQDGGVARPSAKTAFRVAATDKDRGIGAKIKAAPATAVAGTVGLTLFYRAV